LGKECDKTNGATEQIIGREGETATLLLRCPLNSNGLGGGFAPRQLNRSASCFVVSDESK
jgi:hypothetical protein